MHNVCHLAESEAKDCISLKADLFLVFT